MAGEIIGGFLASGQNAFDLMGISATRCKVGSKLAKIDGTVCNSCYARKGTYSIKNVQ
jgi:hypothetical protein